MLKEKDNFIDKCIKDIDNILINGNNKEKNLMEKIIGDRRKYNLRKLQKYTQENMMKNDEMNKIKILDKNRKKIIKGRIIEDYRYISLHSDDEKKKEKKLLELLKKAKNEINLEYCFSEYNNNI